MDNKILVEVNVPTLDSTYSVFLPISKRIYEVTVLLEKGINELSNGLYKPSNNVSLYDLNGQIINKNLIIKQTNIKNGSKIILI